MRHMNTSHHCPVAPVRTVPCVALAYTCTDCVYTQVCRTYLYGDLSPNSM